jgi:hypothetical protein
MNVKPLLADISRDVDVEEVVEVDACESVLDSNYMTCLPTEIIREGVLQGMVRKRECTRWGVGGYIKQKPSLV